MPIMIVDSTQSHLWADALHLRQLARDTPVAWDRGTYVRMCVATCWTALELACQDALGDASIGYSFAKQMDAAILAEDLPPIIWGSGLWQRVRSLQELRKSYVHRFAELKQMFPPASVAEEAVVTVRAAIADIYARTGKPLPVWPAFDTAKGWPENSQFGLANLTSVKPGGSASDPSATRICFVTNGVENTSTILAQGADPSAEIQAVLDSIIVPITEIRVYSGGQLTQSFPVNMRGNA